LIPQTHILQRNFITNPPPKKKPTKKARKIFNNKLSHAKHQRQSPARQKFIQCGKEKSGTTKKEEKNRPIKIIRKR